MDTPERRPVHLYSLKALLPLLAFASQGAMAASTEAVPDTAGVTLDEIAVTASARARDLEASTPQFTLDREMMQRRGVEDFTDALRRMPGLNIRDYGGAGGMKTVSVRGLGAHHTGVVYDGMPLSDCQGGTIDLSRYSLPSVGAITIGIGDRDDIFLPARTASSAASIYIDSNSLTAGTLGQGTNLTASMTTGSFGFVRPYFSIGAKLSDKISLGADAEFTHATNDYPFTVRNGLQTHRERRTNSLMNSGNAQASVHWTPTESSALKGKIYFYKAHRQLPGQVILYKPTANTEQTDDLNAFAQCDYTIKWDERWKLRAYGKFNLEDTHYRDTDGKYPGGIHREDYLQREAYASVTGQYSPTEGWRVSYSADYILNTLHSNLLGDLRPWRSTWLQSVAGRYGNGWLTATARLLWSICDNHARGGEAAADADRLTPSASVSVRPLRSHRWFVRCGYKEIFRMPTFGDNYYFRSTSRELKPEDTRQVNFGMTWDAEPSGALTALNVTVDGYYNRVRNKIVAIPQNMFLWSMSNMARARAVGMDVTLQCVVSPHHGHELTLAGNYSLQRVTSRTSPSLPDYGKQLAYTPLNSGAFSLAWGNPWVDIALSGTGASERYGTNSNLPVSRIAGYMEFGVKLSRDFSLRRVTLRAEAGLPNLLDARYEILADYPMPGRRWSLTLTLKMKDSKDKR